MEKVNSQKIVYEDNSIKLNLGCGANIKKNWINIDNGDQFGEKNLDIIYDLSKGIPFKQEEFDFIFHEHLIEHLTKEEGLVFLKECFRVLKKGGVMRIACPDLKLIIKDYLEDKFKIREWVQKIAPHYKNKSPCELLNITMRDWGHKFIYDEKELCNSLEQVGFLLKNIKVQEINKSNEENLKNLETRADSLVIETRKETQNDQ